MLWLQSTFVRAHRVSTVDCCPPNISGRLDEARSPFSRTSIGAGRCLAARLCVRKRVRPGRHTAGGLPGHADLAPSQFRFPRLVGFALGAADYLIKPIRKTVLLEAIRKFVPCQGDDSEILLVDDDPR